MLKYDRFDITMNKHKKFKIIGFILLTIILIVITVSIGIIYNNNNNNHLQTKRRFNEIELTVKSSFNEIKTELYNYTETMSDFMVDVNYNFGNINKPTINIEDVYKELKHKQSELEKSIKELNELNEKNKRIMIKANAINFLKETYSVDKKDYKSPDVFNCLKREIDVDISNLFESLLEIDYENLTVSFNYFAKDTNDNLEENEKYNRLFKYPNKGYHNNPLPTYLYSENGFGSKYWHDDKSNYHITNVINTPSYKLINNKLEYNYNSYTYNISSYSYHYNYILLEKNIYPFKEICKIKSFYDIFGNPHYSDVNIIRYNDNEYTYINKLINFNSIPIIKQVRFSNEFDYWYK